MAAPALLDTDRNLFAWTLLACLLLLGGLAGPYYAGLVYTSDDLGAFHLPLRWFYAQCLAQGGAFDWSPHLFGGFYLTGEGQIGGYHPLHWLLYRWLPLRAAFDLELLLAYPAMLAGTYFFLRRHLLRRSAALWGAMVFTFSGFNLLHFVHPNAIAVVAHLPWLLACIDRALRTESRQQAALANLAIGLLTASQLLLGYPQYVWFSLLAEALYTAWLAWEGLVQRGRWPQLLLAIGLGTATAGVQLLPTLDSLAHSTRQVADADFVQAGSLHPINLLQTIAPYLFETRVAGQNTHELGCYLGTVPLMLAVWLLCGKGGAPLNQTDSVSARDPAARLLRFALLLGLLAGVLALGQYGGLYKIQTWLPLIGKFRMPARYLVLVNLAFAAAAAVAFLRLLNQRDGATPTWRELSVLWRVVALSIGLAIAGTLLWSGHTAAAWLVWTGPALMAIAALLVSLAARHVRGALVALVLFTAFDLGAYGLSYAVYANALDLNAYLQAGDNPLDSDENRAAVDLLPTGGGAHAGNHLIVRGCRLIDGYSGLEPARMLDYRQTTALQAAGVASVLRRDTTTSLPLAQQQPTSEESNWYSVPQPLPRVRMVGKAVVSRDPAADLAKIPLVTTALVESHVALDAGEPTEPLVDSDRPGHLVVRVRAAGRQLLVFSETYHAGWQAAVDGQSQPVLRVNGDFLGCVVPKGEHRVVFSFEPASLCYGKLLSALGLAGLGLCCVVGLRPWGKVEL